MAPKVRDLIKFLLSQMRRPTHAGVWSFWHSQVGRPLCQPLTERNGLHIHDWIVPRPGNAVICINVLRFDLMTKEALKTFDVDFEGTWYDCNHWVKRSWMIKAFWSLWRLESSLLRTLWSAVALSAKALGSGRASGAPWALVWQRARWCLHVLQISQMLVSTFFSSKASQAQLVQVLQVLLCRG